MSTIEFFFEISSPYSYLAATQIGGVAERAGAAVRWRPMVLGAVFEEAGNAMPALVPAKGAYMRQDLERWARHYGVPFAWPPSFPVRSIAAHRAILAAEREAGPEAGVGLALAIFEACWGRGEDVSEPEVLGAALEACEGLDAQAILEATQDAAIKQALREHTEEAVARGVFGAPTCFVGEEMFWGNDRLDFVEEAARRA